MQNCGKINVSVTSNDNIYTHTVAGTITVIYKCGYTMTWSVNSVEGCLSMLSMHVVSISAPEVTNIMCCIAGTVRPYD